VHYQQLAFALELFRSAGHFLAFRFQQGGAFYNLVEKRPRINRIQS
jgi:hypothetical protein